MENVLESLVLCIVCTICVLVPEWDFEDVIDMAFFIPAVFGMMYFAWNTGIELGRATCHKKPRH
jgi:hypothetical protein